MFVVGWFGPPQTRIVWPCLVYRMAVIGRTPSYFRLMCQATMLASNDALCMAKNIFTSSSIVWLSRPETNWANSAQWPGGNSELGPSAQYSTMSLLVSFRALLNWIIWLTLFWYWPGFRM